MNAENGKHEKKKAKTENEPTKRSFQISRLWAKRKSEEKPLL